ncbi:MAG: DUF559 domain-containing protein [Actinomycetota bacterium]
MRPSWGQISVARATATAAIRMFCGLVRTQRSQAADRLCFEKAETQLGLITEDQLRSMGLSNEARRRRVRERLMLPVLPGICRLPGFEESWRQFVQATWMWLGGRGALSHTTSATMQGILNKGTWPIHLSSMQMSLKSPSDQIVVHRVKMLEGRDLRWFEGIRITNAIRTLFDLAGLLDEDSFDFALDEARRRRLVAERPLREILDRLGTRGRAGSKLLSHVLCSGEMERGIPGSPFERHFLQFARRRSLPLPERQFCIRNETGVEVARVDFAYPDLRIAIECDGKKHHFGVTEWERDVERRSRLAALGWLVIHVSWDMLVHDPDRLELLIRGALGQPSLL